MHCSQSRGVTVAQVILVHFVEVRILTGLPFFLPFFPEKVSVPPQQQARLHRAEKPTFRGLSTAQPQRGEDGGRYQPQGNTANRLWLGRRCGNCGNCGNCEYWGELGAAMQTGLLGRRGKGACLQCCATSRWGVQQTGSGWGGAMGTMRTVGTVGTVGSWAPRCKQACWAQKTNKLFCIVPRPIG